MTTDEKENLMKEFMEQFKKEEPSIERKIKIYVRLFFIFLEWKKLLKE